MKIAKIYKIESAVSKDDTRPAILQPYIQGGRAIATDGRMLASVPVQTEDGEEVEGMRIPLDALKAARKATLKIIHELSLTLTEKSVSVLSGASFPVLHHEVVLLKVAEIVTAKLAKEDATFAVTLDVDLLKRLSEALGTEKLTLLFKDEKSIITVLPSVWNGAFGLLMPIHTV